MTRVKKIGIVVAAFMCVALVLSLLMRSFGSVGTVEEPEEEENDITIEEIDCTSHVDKDDDELCDFCRAPFSDGIECDFHIDENDDGLCDNGGESYTDGCDNHVDKDDNGCCDVCNVKYEDGDDFSGVAHNVNVITGYNITTKDLNYPGFVTLGMFKDGVSLTIDEKFTYHGTTAAAENDRFFGFSVEADSTYENPKYLSLDTADIITIDFDLSTEDSYPFDFHIWPVFRDSGLNHLSYTDKWFHLRGSGTGFSIKQFLADEYQSITATPHFTYVIDVADGDFYVYINGERMFTYEDTFEDAVCLDYIRFYVENGTFPENGESISIDNIAVYTFGNENHSYEGSLDAVIKNSSEKLQDCIDSVLYEGEKQ